MAFGLTNALATFNYLMDRIFCKHCSFTGVFFDDIIVHSKTLEEHKDHLAQVLKELKEHKLYFNSKKSEFFLKEIHYLGHIISKDGIKMDLDKLEIIQEWPQPLNLHELRSFIGMCSYCWGIKPNVGAQVCGRPDTGISFFVYIPNKNSLSPKSFRVSSPYCVSLCSSLRASRTSNPCFHVLAPSIGMRAGERGVCVCVCVCV